jgi:hypothetical protein
MCPALTWGSALAGRMIRFPSSMGVTVVKERTGGAFGHVLTQNTARSASWTLECQILSLPWGLERCLFIPQKKGAAAKSMSYRHHVGADCSAWLVAYGGRNPMMGTGSWSRDGQTLLFGRGRSIPWHIFGEYRERSHVAITCSTYEDQEMDARKARIVNVRMENCHA